VENDIFELYNDRIPDINVTSHMVLHYYDNDRQEMVHKYRSKFNRNR
jgi:hypothetical protein